MGSWETSEQYFMDGLRSRPGLFECAPRMVELLRAVRADEGLAGLYEPSPEMLWVEFRLRGYGGIVSVCWSDGAYVVREDRRCAAIAAVLEELRRPRLSFADLAGFRRYAGGFRLTHAVIFKGEPERAYLDALEPLDPKLEGVVLLDAGEDRGFLASTKMSFPERMPDGEIEPNDKALAEIPLVCWGYGHPLSSANGPGEAAQAVKFARRWAGLTDEDVPGIRSSREEPE